MKRWNTEWPAWKVRQYSDAMDAGRPRPSPARRRIAGAQRPQRAGERLCFRRLPPTASQLPMPQPLPPFRAALLAPKHWPAWVGLGAIRLAACLPHAWLMRIGRGLGWLLMKHIIGYAKEKGLRTVRGQVLNENASMLQMCGELGFHAHDDPDERGVKMVELPLDEVPAAISSTSP